MFTTCALFLAYVKFSYDTEDILNRYRLFSFTGMPEKEQMRTIGKEMWGFTLPPLIISVAGAVLFHILTFDIRMYSAGQIRDYLASAGVIGLLYLILQLLWTGWLVHQMRKKIRKNNR